MGADSRVSDTEFSGVLGSPRETGARVMCKIFKGYDSSDGTYFFVSAAGLYGSGGRGQIVRVVREAMREREISRSTLASKASLIASRVEPQLRELLDSSVPRS